jgi:uncharacterized membrane protein YidH (DUF202 family)
MNDPTKDAAAESSLSKRIGAGLANERTVLAWTRSALSLAAIAGLIAHAATDAHAYAIGYPLVVLLLVGALLTWRYGSHIYTDNRRAVAAGEPVARPRALKLLAALTTTSGAIALTITVISI